MQKQDQANWETLRKDYSLVKIIGQGAYGTVCKAIRRDNKQTYAIKMIKFKIDDGYAFKQVLREISILRQLT